MNPYLADTLLEIDADVLCVYGWEPCLVSEALLWLSLEKNRKLVFVDEREDLEAPINALANPRIRAFTIQTPLQIESIAAKIGKLSVFLKLHIMGKNASPYFPLFQERLSAHHELASLQLSDAADFGCVAIQNALLNLSRPFKSCMDLKGAFSNIPAILVGAGPSLEKNGAYLAGFKNKGLILAGGTALNKIPCSPHLGACIDKAAPILKSGLEKIPFCFQARMHPENFQTFQGEALLAPDSHFPFLNWISKDLELFNGGWTVGNFMAALAVFFGCNPIVCVGMDYCYYEGKKYAFDTIHSQNDLVSSQDGFGKEVRTQKDWLMARQWMEDIAKQNREISFYNANGSGLPFWNSATLENFEWPEIPDLQEKIDQKIRNLPFRSCVSKGEWKDLLLQTLNKLQGKEEIQEEEIYSQMLFPLWNLWQPIFEREIDPYALSLEEKLNLHKKLFFEQILQEHLNLS